MNHKKIITEKCQMMTVKDVKEFLGIGNNTVYKLFKSKDFPSIIIGRIHLIRKQSFLDWLTQQENISKLEGVI